MATITQDALLDAAFWHEGVCLDCGAVQDDETAGNPCEVCASINTLPAGTILQVLALVEEWD